MTISSNLINTHYNVLGVKEDASYEQIRATYRALVLRSHPDKLLKDSETSTSDHETSNRFLELQQAWEILSNPKLRATCDKELKILRQDVATSEDVSFEDLTVEDTGESLECSYRCRCGDYFAIDSSELEEMGYLLSKNGSTITLMEKLDMGSGEECHHWCVFDCMKKIPVEPEALMAEINSAISVLEYGRAKAFLETASFVSKNKSIDGKSKSQYDQRKADEAYKEGRAAVAAGKLDEAVNSLNFALSKCPPNKTSAIAKLQSLISVTSQQLKDSSN